jgi:hypothetical protein
VKSLKKAVFREKSYFLNLRRGTLGSVEDNKGEEEVKGNKRLVYGYK